MQPSETARALVRASTALPDTATTKGNVASAHIANWPTAARPTRQALAPTRTTTSLTMLRLSTVYRLPTTLSMMLLVSACASSAPRRPDVLSVPCCSREALDAGLQIAQRFRVDAIADRRFTHERFWNAVSRSVASPSLRNEVVGRSMLGRDIHSITFGSGSTTVLLWSQMHGDESTATMAFADIFRFLVESQHDPLHERLRERLTLVFVPMLNPDGAELFQRENAAGIDVNRDARMLATPEARTLKSVRDKLRPSFAFNLHDQGARTRVGATGLQSAIALLAPAYDDAKSYNDVRARARLVAATLAQLLGHDIPGRVAKYDDTFNPRAFGDLMQQWGTSVVLIESGALPNDPQKQRLRALNVAGILGALDAIATGSFASVDPDVYERLPVNAGGATDVLIAGARLVLPGQEPLRADIAINYDDPVARSNGRVRDVGDLREVVALDTVRAEGLFVHPTAAALTTRGGRSWLRLGAAAVLELRRGASASSELVRKVGGEDER